MMRRVFVLISLVVAILVIVGNVFAQDKISNIPEPSLDPEWKLLGIDSGGKTVYLNTRKINYLQEGIVEVWILSVLRGELREMEVNRLILKGEDPNNAERLWYVVILYKINCKTHQMAYLQLFAYSFEKTVLFFNSSQYEKWYGIVPGSVMEAVEGYVCKKDKDEASKASIPEPSLDPAEWKLMFTFSDGETFYLNTRNINYLPKGIVEVWTLHVPRGELRKDVVNSLKNDLISEGKDPNEAERLWYIIFFRKINCRTHQAYVVRLFYSFEGMLLYSDSSQAKTIGDLIEKFVCKKHKKKK